MKNLEAYAEENRQQISAEKDPFSCERYIQFGRHLKPSSIRILDVGCATGRGGTELKKTRPESEIFGLDCVAERLDKLPEAYSGKILGLSNEIPAEDQAFDAVLAGEFIEHLYPADVDPSLCEFQRVLKIGGQLLLTTPNPRYVKNRLKGLSVYSVSHLTQHFPECLRLRLMSHGFSRVRIFGSGRVSRYLGQRFPWLPAYGSYLVTALKA